MSRRLTESLRPAAPPRRFESTFALSMPRATAHAYRIEAGTLRFQNETGTISPPDRRSAVPGITIKNVPPDLLEALMELAAEHHRSLNGEVIIALRRAVLARSGS